jgi:hypothetical protein
LAADYKITLGFIVYVQDGAHAETDTDFSVKSREKDGLAPSPLLRFPDEFNQSLPLSRHDKQGWMLRDEFVFGIAEEIRHAAICHDYKKFAIEHENEIFDAVREFEEKRRVR